jgi:metallo-beta-lactamase class B
MQILKGLYQVGGDINGITFDQPGAIWNDANSYVLETPQGLIMFDCGCGDTIDQIFENMRYWGLSPDQVKYCFLTHPHLDHAGGAYILKKMGVEILGIEQTASAVAAADERCCGYLYHKTFNPVTVDHILYDGQKLTKLGVEIGVMHLPGHSMACTAFDFMLGTKKVVISGDVIGTLLVGDFGWSGSIDFDKKIYTESLRKFSRVDMDVMVPGHGMVCFHKPRHRVEQALNAALIQWR